MGTRKLCSWDRTRMKKKAGKLRALVSKPTHLCVKCARVANAGKHLCAPVKLDEME